MMRTKNDVQRKPSRDGPGGLFCPQKPPLTEGKVSTGVGVMSKMMCLRKDVVPAEQMMCLRKDVPLRGNGGGG